MGISNTSVNIEALFHSYFFEANKRKNDKNGTDN